MNNSAKFAREFTTIMEHSPEIEQLKRDVEIRVGRPLKSPVDFDLLSLKVSEKLRENISSTTIKRLWGYISTQHTPRFSTLSTLARYLGFADWDGYRLSILREASIESSFLSCRQIRTIDLIPGDRIELQWLPNRRCVVQYQGENQFRVHEALNAKLSVGDTFKSINFTLNHPLYVTELRHGEGVPVSYVAGHRTGLTSLSLLK